VIGKGGTAFRGPRSPKRTKRPLPSWIWALVLAVSVLAGSASAAETDKWELRICADPNNLPFSNDRLEGFENKIAELLARELNAEISYYWWPQRRAFSRETLREGHCDLVLGVPDNMGPLNTTLPYYRSTYVFVYRTDRDFDITSFDDPILRELTIGVQLIGDGYINSPPAHALGNRGMSDNLVGFSVLGDYDNPHVHAPIIEAVAEGRIDVAVVWGPIAGYYAKRQSVPLTLVPVSPPIDFPFLPMTYAISMGVRRSEPSYNDPLTDRLNRFILEHRDEIESILREYGVPLL